MGLDYLSGVLGATALAHVAARSPPKTCGTALWTFGEVLGVLQRVEVCCGESDTFLRLADGAGWFVDDEVALGGALRTRASELCGAAKISKGSESMQVIARLGDGTRARCGTEKHMYEHGDVSGTREVQRDSDCVADRHVAAYGETGLPERPVEAALQGHLEPIGLQGQPRRAVVEVDGCDDDLMWRHAYRNQPLLQRGCAAARSPETMKWTSSYLHEFAGGHTSRYCQEPFRAYLARMNSTDRKSLYEYRNCGELPKSLLRQVAVPFPLQHPPCIRTFDKVVLWYGRSNVSPLHFDPNHNYMHQLAGQKRILLVDPADSALLYSDHASSAVGNTPIDPFKVDLEKHPLVRHVGLWPLVLHKGDILFIPSGWWHMVITVPSVGDELFNADVRNMAITVQFDRGITPSVVSHFSRHRAELYLNIPEEVPTPEEMNARDRRMRGQGEQPLALPATMAELSGSEDMDPHKN